MSSSLKYYVSAGLGKITILVHTSVNELLSTKISFLKCLEVKDSVSTRSSLGEHQENAVQSRKAHNQQADFSTSDPMLLRVGSTGLEQPNSIAFLQ